VFLPQLSHHSKVSASSRTMNNHPKALEVEQQLRVKVKSDASRDYRRLNVPNRSGIAAVAKQESAETRVGSRVSTNLSRLVGFRTLFAKEKHERLTVNASCHSSFTSATARALAPVKIGLHRCQAHGVKVTENWLFLAVTTANVYVWPDWN
jgi:hypothetical protein